MSRDYLTTADVLGLHDVLLQRYGGAEGVRDIGAVEAAVFRPQCGYYTDIVQEACALMESLLINHPFVDGNKRTAFVAADVFLYINGYCISKDDACLLKMLLHWLSLKPAQRFSKMEEDLRGILQKC